MRGEKVVHVVLPYDVTTDDLFVEPRSMGHKDSSDLEWLYTHATEEELPRILTGAVALWQAGAGSIGECLDTAIVWERG